MPARLRLSWGMKTLKLFFLPLLESLEFGWQLIRYALIFVSAFRQRVSLLKPHRHDCRRNDSYWAEGIFVRHRWSPISTHLWRDLWIQLVLKLFSLVSLEQSIEQLGQLVGRLL
jgi:hypothetical protein